MRAVEWILADERLDGVINLASPHPLPNRDFMRGLREAWGVSIGLPATKWMIEIGTLLMRSESELVLKSRRVVPGKLADAGFGFTYGEWGDAARELVGRWKEKELRREDRKA